MGIDKKIKDSKAALFLIGGTLLVLGITLVIAWWPDVVTVFRGFAGVIIALGGMVVLYMVKE